MNNKGFSLIELLVVLVILSAIISIAIPSITSAVERNKQKTNDKKIEIIISQAEEYASIYKNKIKRDEDNNFCINISSIIEVGLLTQNDIIDTDNNSLDGSVKYNNNTKTYSYNKNKCEV